MENKYTAIIVEPRKHKALEFVLNNFQLKQYITIKVLVYINHRHM